MVTDFGAGMVTAGMAAVFFRCGTETPFSFHKDILETSHSFFNLSKRVNIAPKQKDAYSPVFIIYENESAVNLFRKIGRMCRFCLDIAKKM
jgi:hypothetical protein